MTFAAALSALAGSSGTDILYPTCLKFSPPTEHDLYTTSLSVPGTPYYPDQPTTVPGPIARPTKTAKLIGLGFDIDIPTSTINRVIPRNQERRDSSISSRRAPLVKAGIIPSPNPQGNNYPTVPSGIPGWPDLIVVDDIEPYDGDDNDYMPPITSTSSSTTLADAWDIQTPPMCSPYPEDDYCSYIIEPDQCCPAIPDYLNAPSPGQLPSPHFYTPKMRETPYLTATPPYLKAPPAEDLPVPIFCPQPTYPSFTSVIASNPTPTSDSPVARSSFRPFSPEGCQSKLPTSRSSKPLNPNAPLFQSRGALIYETGTSS